MDKARWKRLYLPSASEPALVDVPEMRFLMVDGEGAPESAAFQQALEALYGVCYTLKFMHPKGHPIRDAKVMPLEALWSSGGPVFDLAARGDWRWTAMIVQPDAVTPEAIDAAVAELRRKKDPPGLARVRFESFHEGLAVQILHVGPYSAEGPTIERLHRYAEEQVCCCAGRHHEIYLGDPRRAKPERLKTVLRQPVRRE